MIIVNAKIVADAANIDAMRDGHCHHGSRQPRRARLRRLYVQH